MLRENGKDPCTAAKFGTMLKEQHFKVIERQERSLTYSMYTFYAQFQTC